MLIRSEHFLSALTLAQRQSQAGSEETGVGCLVKTACSVAWSWAALLNLRLIRVPKWLEVLLYCVSPVGLCAFSHFLAPSAMSLSLENYRRVLKQLALGLALLFSSSGPRLLISTPGDYTWNLCQSFMGQSCTPQEEPLRGKHKSNWRLV